MSEQRVIVDEGAMRRVWSAILVWVILLWEVGCSSLGPWSITRDRFDYTTAISDSWKDQMLMNLVKLRYGEPPVFLDIASLISSLMTPIPAG